MAYHYPSIPNARISFVNRTRFPFKLWDVVNDKHPLLCWRPDGMSFSAREIQFQENVMFLYPGFVQISSFANFRRLLREYGFDWHFDENGLDMVFSSPYFVRGRHDLLNNILTKRKNNTPLKPRKLKSNQQMNHVDLAGPNLNMVPAYGTVMPTKTSTQCSYHHPGSYYHGNGCGDGSYGSGYVGGYYCGSYNPCSQFNTYGQPIYPYQYSPCQTWNNTQCPTTWQPEDPSKAKVEIPVVFWNESNQTTPEKVEESTQKPCEDNFTVTVTDLQPLESISVQSTVSETSSGILYTVASEDQS